MASLMIYLALTACATTAVGVYAGSDMVSWDDEDWWDEDDCDRSARTGVHVAGGLHVGAGARGGCDRTDERSSERDGCRPCGRDG